MACASVYHRCRFGGFEKPDNVVRVDSESLRSLGCETHNVGSIDSEGSRTLVSEPIDNVVRVDSESLRSIGCETDNV